mgnify:CR=1 FL=1
MTRTMRVVVAVCISAVMIFSGCAKQEPAEAPPEGLSVEKVVVTAGLKLPESVAIDPTNGKLYVTNVVTDNEGYWVDDNNGFISLLSPEAEVEELQWLESSAEAPIHAPKGTCIVNGRLYFTDNTELKYCSLGEAGEVKVISLAGAKQLNDLATDGESVWATDSGTGKVFCVAMDGSSREVKGPEGINGITCYKGKVFAVSWDLHEVYELDPTGEKEPVPFALASHFTNLDGIELLDDGTFIVSDYMGNKVCSISADRKTVKKLIELESPADLGFDREKMLLYVPEMLANRMTVLKLKE